jgi:hypothetical protein
MKKLIIALAAFGLLVGCSPQELHKAYQKTKDSYAFAKGAYRQVREDAKSVLQDIEYAAENLQQDLHYAGKDFENAKASLSYSFDKFKGCDTMKEFSEKE